MRNFSSLVRADLSIQEAEEMECDENEDIRIKELDEDDEGLEQIDCDYGGTKEGILESSIETDSALRQSLFVYAGTQLIENFSHSSGFKLQYSHPRFNATI